MPAYAHHYYSSAAMEWRATAREASKYMVAPWLLGSRAGPAKKHIFIQSRLYVKYLDIPGIYYDEYSDSKFAAIVLL